MRRHTNDLLEAMVNTDQNSVRNNALAERFHSELQVVGRTLQNLRDNCGFSLEDAACAADITAQRVACIETGQDNNVDMMVLMKLAKLYKTSPACLLDDVPSDKFIEVRPRAH